ncbi:TPA: acetylglucosaminyldiphospho-UDP acetyl-beta-D-mannosaminyltransferase [Candidatus Peribacteria bacterium]|nr:acetylglucosaminyldiphospho-UDP acetyl-beta-D-mannosaminyltransferase [Candidatus Peribacteria bacterium]HAS34480.1 acetylglucosaminyldiphospho-UDP acetyl-beta-D-mannosaminyltransferase [Candidatus Peribacteria bacterium]
MRIRGMLAEPRFHHVMTPNSEMLVEACRNTAFRKILQAAALNLPDSIGLKWMAHLTGQTLPARVAGVDTVMALLKNLPEEHAVFLLGAAEGVAERAGGVLKKMNPRLKIAGTYAGSPGREDAQTIIDRICQAQPHLLLVAYGAPKQDLWIAEHARVLLSVRVAMGVGGTFDFLAGTAHRAPRWMRSVGLEWLWRVLLEPWRLKRIWNAVVVFPILVMRYGREAPTL